MDQLYLFRQALALAQHRNFARAAESLNLSQPSLTRGIATLEQSLGVLLFERGRGGAVPTAFGRVLLERAEALLKGHADLRRELQLLAGLEAGTLAIGAGPYAAETLVADAVGRLAGSHPRLRIECTQMPPMDVVKGVLAGHFDVGVAGGEDFEHESDLVIQSFAPIPICFGCRTGHPILRETGCPKLDRLLAYPLVTVRLRGSEARIVRRARGLPGVATQRGEAPDYVPDIVVNSLSIARIIARGSDAIVPGIAQSLAEDFATGRLVRVEVEGPPLQTVLSVLHRRDRPLAPAASAFIAMLSAADEDGRRAPGEAAPRSKRRNARSRS